jgi:hypothetical protein
MLACFVARLALLSVIFVRFPWATEEFSSSARAVRRAPAAKEAAGASTITDAARAEERTVLPVARASEGSAFYECFSCG